LSISESTFESLSESTPRYGAPEETIKTKIYIEKGGQLCQHKKPKQMLVQGIRGAGDAR
jgi:hypothetical protein